MKQYTELEFVEAVTAHAQQLAAEYVVPVTCRYSLINTNVFMVSIDDESGRVMNSTSIVGLRFSCGNTGKWLVSVSHGRRCQINENSLITAKVKIRSMFTRTLGEPKCSV